MKKILLRVYGLLLCTAMCIGAVSCTRDEEVPKMEASELDDFTTYDGNVMTATPEGYYVIQEEFLYYISPDFQSSTIVCSKPDCIHNEQDLQNSYEYTECDAFYLFGGGIDYCDGYLYIQASPDGRKDAVYRTMLDGSERTLWYENEGENIINFGIYKGYAYLAQETYTTEGKAHAILRFPVNDPDKEEVLFETEEYPDSSINRMRFYDGDCYFYLFSPAGKEADGDSVHLKINLEDGRTEQFYETSNCRLEWDDYGILTEVQEYISYNPMQWTSKYFHVLPDSGEKVQLTEEDFQSIGTNDMLYNMDDKYIYFGTINIGVDTLPEEEQVLTVYDYEGNIKAKIPAGDYGNYYFVLPGTDEYLFITKMNTDGSDAYFYADKSEFDGGTVEAHEINFAGIR